MYKKIEAMKPIYFKYTEELINSGKFTKEEIEKEYTDAFNKIDKIYQASRKEVFDPSHWRSKPDEKLIDITKYGRIKDTGVPIQEIRRISEKINILPEDVEAHPTIKKIYEQRYKSV